MPISTKCTIARAAQSLGTPGSPLSRGCHNGDCLNREPFRAPPAAVDLGPCRTAAPTTRDVHLLVPDVDRAARSYRDEAGLTELSHWADPTFGGTIPVSMQRGLAGVTVVSSPRELTAFRCSPGADRGDRTNLPCPSRWHLGGAAARAGAAATSEKKSSSS
jgi:hypothetical protein